MYAVLRARGLLLGGALAVILVFHILIFKATKKEVENDVCDMHQHAYVITHIYNIKRHQRHQSIVQYHEYVGKW